MKRTSSEGKFWFTMVCLATAASCARTHLGQFDGLYRGTDGSNRVSSDVESHLALTGDKLLVGVWESAGEIKKAQFTGEIGYFFNELNVDVQAGDCVGKFTGQFKVLDGAIEGALSGNPACPDHHYAFKFTKST